MKSGNQLGLGRTNTTSGASSGGVAQKRKMTGALQTMLKHETQRRQEAEKQLLEYRMRSLYIEKEFTRILQKYDHHVATINGKENYGQGIWNKLVDQIDCFNKRSQEMLEKRCNEITFMMNRRINEILERTDSEIKKNKKLSEDQYRTVKQQIKEALKIAKDIQDQNQHVKKANHQLIFKNKVLRQERNLLVEELYQKKLMIFKLSKEPISQNPSQNPQISRVKVRKSISINQTISFPKFMCEPSFFEQSNTIILQSPENTTLTQRTTNKGKKEDKGMKNSHHFRLCLDREQRKVLALKGIISKLQSKQKEVCQIIDLGIKQIEYQKDFAKKNKKYQQLVEGIRFKVYLSSYKNDHAGLSQEELNQLLAL